MKFLPCLLPVVMLTACAVAGAQSPEKPGKTADAQKTFDILKGLVGAWQGSVTTDNAAWSTDKPVPLAIRVASHGNALVHELNTGGPEATVFYVESDQLALIHYCDFGNRPHMLAQPAPDGKTIDFDLKDLSGSKQMGYVSRGVFTIIDQDHHIEDWTFMLPTGKPMHAHIDFKRAP